MSHEPRWIRVTQSKNIPLREGRAVNVGSRELAIFNLGDRFLAIENRCPHRGGPLADGIVSGNVVVCPLHAWKVCLDDGSVVKPAEESACLSSYRTRVEDGVVSVQLPAKPRPAKHVSAAEDAGEDGDELPALVSSSSSECGDAAGRPDLEFGTIAG